MTGVSVPMNIMIASGTQASSGIGPQQFEYRKHVFLEPLRPAEEQAERHAEQRCEEERDRERAAC